MERIFNDAKDVNVANYVLYANSSNALFYDKEMTKAFNAANDGLELFKKGVVAVKSGTYYAAKSCTAAGVITFNF